MFPNDYEYRGLMATAWDLLRGDTSEWPDRSFYWDIVLHNGQPVLDVGCGTGRLLLDYLSRGIDIDGVDNSPDMLEICRKKAQQQGLTPTLYLQSMESLALPRQYQTILVPSSSFQLVLDIQASKETMRRFSQHLLLGGLLVMPFFLMGEGHSGESKLVLDWEKVGESVNPQDGTLIRRWSRSTLDLIEHVEHTEDRYEVLKDGEVVTTEVFHRSPATRWYTQEQIKELFEEAGFRHLRFLKGFSQEPASSSDTLFTVLGRRGE